MKVHILHAAMSYSKEEGYVGLVQFEAEGHREPYEIALQSKRGKDWGYGLFFKDGNGKEELLNEIEEEIEENDELFEQLIQAGMNALQQ